MILLHGLPGDEKNLDLAQDLRAAGLVVMFFFHRGAWGSEGDYRLAHLVPDTRVALDSLVGRPEVDRQRVALIGFSLGGWAALAAAAEDRRARAAVLVAPLVDPAATPLSPEAARASSDVLKGTAPDRLAEEWAGVPKALDLVARLEDQPVLLVTAGEDEIFPPGPYARIVSTFPSVEWIRFPHADHLFSEVRDGLSFAILSWLGRVWASN